MNDCVCLLPCAAPRARCLAIRAWNHKMPQYLHTQKHNQQTTINKTAKQKQSPHTHQTVLVSKRFRKLDFARFALAIHVVKHLWCGFLWFVWVWVFMLCLCGCFCLWVCLCAAYIIVDRFPWQLHSLLSQSILQTTDAHTHEQTHT